MEACIRVQADGPVTTVVLHNPDKLNAMSRTMWRELRVAFVAIAADPHVRCVLLRGAGPHFCAGGDIAEYPGFRFDAEQLQHFHEEEVWGALAAILACDVPVLAQIQGVCMGAGVEIASACDLRLAAGVAADPHQLAGRPDCHPTCLAGAGMATTRSAAANEHPHRTCCLAPPR